MCFCHCFVIVSHYLDNRGDNWALSLSHVKTSGGAACFVIRTLLVLEVESSLIAFLQENPQWVSTLLHWATRSKNLTEFNIHQQVWGWFIQKTTNNRGKLELNLLIPICPEKGGEEFFILIEENSLLPPLLVLPLVQLIAVRAAQPPDMLIFSDISFN